MTDKQIIIDGVDVSGCIYLKMNNKMPMCRACNSGVGSPYCEYHKDCYYKQLKTKEQECNKFYIQLKADEEYHKEEESTLREIIKNKEERNIELYKENNKLKQALTEIKEIAKNMNNECFYDDFDCEDCDMKNGCTYQGKIKILQKISGTENAR